MFLDKFVLGVWNVGFIDGSPEEIVSKGEGQKIQWMKHRYKDRFFADPFLLSADENNYYVLAEEFKFYTDLGGITLLTVDRKTKKLTARQELISDEYHYSYPYVYGNEIIPECFISDKCRAFSLENGKITGTRTVMEQGLIDQTFLDYDGREWVFATDKDNRLCGLKIFYREKGSENWLAHRKNPVKDDVKTARPGGNFFQMDGKIYRPVQDSELLYGHKIRIMRLDKLTPDEFEETEVAVLSSAGNPPYDMGFHTLNFGDGFAVVDGYREYHSFFVKPLCLKAKGLMRRLGERK